MVISSGCSREPTWSVLIPGLEEFSAKSVEPQLSQNQVRIVLPESDSRCFDTGCPFVVVTLSEETCIHVKKALAVSFLHSWQWQA